MGRSASAELSIRACFKGKNPTLHTIIIQPDLGAGHIAASGGVERRFRRPLDRQTQLASCLAKFVEGAQTLCIPKSDPKQSIRTKAHTVGVAVPFAILLPNAWFGRQSSGIEFRSEEHTSELQSLMRNSYAVF